MILSLHYDGSLPTSAELREKVRGIEEEVMQKATSLEDYRA